MPYSAASHLGPYCSPMSHKKDAMLTGVQSPYNRNKCFNNTAKLINTSFLCEKTVNPDSHFPLPLSKF